MENRFEDTACVYRLFEEFLDHNDVVLQEQIGKIISKFYSSDHTTNVITAFEAGCGIGNTATHILDADRRITLHTVDLDPGMVEMTTQKLSSFIPSRLKVETKDIGVGLQESEPFMLFVSALTLHNVIPLEKRKEALRLVFDRLAPGGLFIDGDKIADNGDTDYWKRYNDRMERLAVLAEHGQGHMVEFWRAHEREDRQNLLSLGAYIDLLKEIGFVDIQVRGEFGLYKIVTARK